MPKYYQEHDVHEGEYSKYIVRVSSHERELKDKLLLTSYQRLGGGELFLFHRLMNIFIFAIISSVASRAKT